MNNEVRKYFLTPCARQLFRKSNAELGLTVSAPPGSFGVSFGSDSYVVVQPTAAPTVTGWLAIASGRKSLISRGATPEAALENLKKTFSFSPQKNAAEHQRYIRSIHFAENTDGFLDAAYDIRSRLKESFKRSSQANEPLEQLMFLSLSHAFYLFKDFSIGEIKIANEPADASKPRGRRGDIGSEDAYAYITINEQLFRFSFYEFLGLKEHGEKIVIHHWSDGKWYLASSIKTDANVIDPDRDFLKQKIEGTFNKIEAFALLKTPAPQKPLPQNRDAKQEVCIGLESDNQIFCAVKVELCQN